MEGTIKGENVRFSKILNEMKHNKHFKEYFLFHEKSLRQGLVNLDANLGHREYFRDLFMQHLEKENRFRKLNKDIFDHMKDESKTREKTIPQIKQQKKKIMASLSPYKGIKSTDVARVED